MRLLSLSLLGGFRLRSAPDRDIPIPLKKAQALLGYLGLRAGESVFRDAVTALLWADVPAEQARHSLRQALFAIRKALPPGTPALVIEGEALGLDPASVEVDAMTFASKAREGSPGSLRDAVDLYRGDLLAGLSLEEPAFEEWLTTERERLRAVATAAMTTLFERQLASGALDDAFDTGHRLLGLDPLQEDVHRRLMRAHASAGRIGAALRQYQSCLDVLRTELGVEPQPETKRLYQELLRGDGGVGGGIEPRVRRGRSPRLAERTADSVRGLPPFIGRRREAETAGGLLSQASRGRGGVIVVSGEAGIGKTRFAEQIASGAARRRGRVLRGRCHDLARVLPFGPWIEALRDGGPRLLPEDLEGIERGARRDLGLIFPELATRSPDSQHDRPDASRIFAAVATLLQLIAARRPVVVVLDDLQWADEMSVRLLSFLARGVSQHSMLLVGTARDEDLLEAPLLYRLVAELDRAPSFCRIRLGALSRPETSELVRSLDSGRHALTTGWDAERIWELSEGNPFIAIEMFRALAENGTVDGPASGSLPERVHRLIAGRLARVDETGRQLVATAAVIGRAFDAALLSQAAGLDARVCSEALEDLVLRGIFHRSAESHAFAHDRIRETARHELSRERRRQIHGAVGLAIESLHSADLEPYVAELATHFREAELWPQAVAYLRRAGIQALRRAAHHDSARAFDEALAILARLEDTPDAQRLGVDIRAELCNTLAALGERERLMPLVDESKALAERLGDPAVLARVFTIAAYCLRVVGNDRAGVEIGTRALELANASGSVPQIVATNLALGASTHRLGAYRRAVALFERNVTLLTGDLVHMRSGAGLPAVMSRSWAAFALAELGEFPQAHQLAREARAIADAADHPHAQASAAWGMSMLLFRQGHLDEAVPVLELGLAHCERWSLQPLYFHGSAGMLAATYALLGRLGDALPLLEKAEESARALDQLPRISTVCDAHLLAGRLEEALARATWGVEQFRECGDRGYEGWSLRLLGEVLAAQGPGNVAAARARYDEALDIARELGMRPLTAQCHLGIGRLLHRAGQPDEARGELTEAVRTLGEMDMRFWLKEAEAALRLLDAS